MRKTVVGILIAGAMLVSRDVGTARTPAIAKWVPGSTTEVGGDDMRDAVVRLAHAIGQPIGWVVASDDLKPCPVPETRVTAGDPRQALDWIVAHCPEYAWVQDQLGIVIQPARPMKSILDLPVRSFSLSNVKAYDAEMAVWDLPEVKQWFRANRVRQLTMESGTKWRGTLPTFSIELHDVPLRAVLNQIAVRSGRMTWTIVWFDRNTYMGIYL